jgi:para-nitrobenzyl esterase
LKSCLRGPGPGKQHRLSFPPGGPSDQHGDAEVWTNFAKTGDPNGEGLPKWPLYAADTQWQVMHLGSEPMAAPDTHRAQDLLLDSIWGK